MSNQLLRESLIFQAIWLFVLFTQSPLLTACLILLWFLFFPLPNNTLGAIVAVASFGIVVDYVLMSMGLLYFDLKAAWSIWGMPVWLILLWLAFARFIMMFIQLVKWSAFIKCSLFVTGGFASYAAADQWALIQVNWNRQDLVLVFVVWWLVLPFSVNYYWQKHG